MHENTVKNYWDLFSNQNWEEAKTLLHRDFIAEWPQSRERFTSGEAYVEMNKAYPGTHQMQILQIMSVNNKVVSTVFIHAPDTGQKTFATSWFEFQDDKIVKLTEFWGAPYPAPADRKIWAESY